MSVPEGQAKMNECLFLEIKARGNVSVPGDQGKREHVYSWRSRQEGTCLFLESKARGNVSVPGDQGKREHVYSWRSRQEGTCLFLDGKARGSLSLFCVPTAREMTRWTSFEVCPPAVNLFFSVKFFVTERVQNVY